MTTRFASLLALCLIVGVLLALWLLDLPAGDALGGLPFLLRSRSSTSSSSSSRTETLNLGQQDIDGTAVSNVGGVVSITQTDHGAIDAGRELALEAIGSADRNFDTAIGFAGDVLAGGAAQNELVAETLRDSYGDALAFAGDTTARAFESADSARLESFDLARGFAEEVGSLVDRVIDTVSGTGERFVQFVEGVQSRESLNTDARLEDTTRTALYLGGGVAALALLAAFWRK